MLGAFSTVIAGPGQGDLLTDRPDCLMAQIHEALRGEPELTAARQITLDELPFSDRAQWLEALKTAKAKTEARQNRSWTQTKRQRSGWAT